MRIALVSPYDLAAPGGVQGQVIGLAGALRAGGDEVLLLGPGDPTRWAVTPGDRGPTGEGGVGVGRSVAVPANGSRAPVALSPLAGGRTRRALGRFGPDVVHVHEPFVPGPALAAARSGLFPVVATFHRAGATALYRMLGPWLGRVLTEVDRPFAVSDAARETLARVVGPEGRSIDVLANAVDLGRMADAASDPSPKVGPTVVFVGRHEPRKGLELLLKAASTLPEDVTVWVVGDGPERRRLEARHGGGRIVFLGRLAGPEVARRIAGADVLVAPSISGESFGVVLLEAMAGGTAVLAADLPGYRLAGGDAVRYVPPGDQRALASELSGLLADDAGRATLVSLGRVRAEAHGFASLARSYRGTYEELAASPR